jgi:hypothetical protein
VKKAYLKVFLPADAKVDDTEEEVASNIVDKLVDSLNQDKDEHISRTEYQSFFGVSIVRLKNFETHRYVFSHALKNEHEGSEGGWIGPKTQDKPLIGVDANYYNLAAWEVEHRGEYVLLRHRENRRLIFDQGPKFEGNRGDEGGWVGPNTKKALAADANYYNLAMWKVQRNSNGTITLINLGTNRMLFDPGNKFEGKPTDEGGWVASHIKPLVTVDANYYNRAMWVVEGTGL